MNYGLFIVKLNERVIIFGELEINGVQAVMTTSFMTLFWHSSGGTEEKYENFRIFCVLAEFEAMYLSNVQLEL
jgi:hypothetical protein